MNSKSDIYDMYYIRFQIRYSCLESENFPQHDQTTTHFLLGETSGMFRNFETPKAILLLMDKNPAPVDVIVYPIIYTPWN